MTGLEKSKEFFCRAMGVLTLDDQEYTRATYMLLFGFNRLQLVDTKRPYFRILRKLIELGRKNGSITCLL